MPSLPDHQDAPDTPVDENMNELWDEVEGVEGVEEADEADEVDEVEELAPAQPIIDAPAEADFDVRGGILDVFADFVDFVMDAGEILWDEMGIPRWI